MILGVTFPALCLILFELLNWRNLEVIGKYGHYKIMEQRMNEEKLKESLQEIQESDSDNNFSIKVIRIGIIASGILVCVLGAVATTGKTVVILVGSILVLVGYLIGKKKRNHEK